MPYPGNRTRDSIRRIRSGGVHSFHSRGEHVKALVTGATGLVGQELVRRLEQASVLSRDVRGSEQRFGKNVRAWAWQPESGPAPAAAFDGVDAVFHLAGEPVAEGRWTSEKKRRIEQSRVLGTRHLVAALA